MENLYEKPKPGQKLDTSSAYPEVKDIDKSKDIIDASVNPKIDPKDLSSEIKVPLYPELPKPKKEELKSLYTKEELKQENIKGKNINSSPEKPEKVVTIGEIDNKVNPPATAELKNINPSLKKLNVDLNLGNVNQPKKK